MRLKELIKNIYDTIYITAGLVFFISYFIAIVLVMYPYYKYKGWDLKKELEDMLA